MNRRHRRCLAGLLLLVAGGHWLQAGYIHAKALFAQHLLEFAWQRTLAGEHRVRPWPWADVWPVARLEVPHLGLDLVVLNEASGEAMAFGPGLVPLAPGSAGRVVAGHRDTHFRALQGLRGGDLVRLTTADGDSHRYRIRYSLLLDTARQDLMLDPDRGQLVLVTCYPFEAVSPGATERYALVAE